MTLYIYNTLTRTKQEFIPLMSGQVSMYVCGPTVYDYCHLGHGRAYVTFDVIYRYLKYKGYNVTYVRNVTDIDDKIIARANKMDLPDVELKEKVSALTQKYLSEFNADMESLGLLAPTYEPKATEYIPNMIELIRKLIKNGLAYEVSGNVYYEVAKFADYGKLSGRSPDELLAGARVEPEPEKRVPLDFSLWKRAKPQEPWWDSPWGEGRPGWHIECSSMSLSLLGEMFDIHGGGQDLIFPHHENEIAQSCGCTGKQPVRYWIHNGFVTINKEKMSKSLGNFFTLKDIFKKYNPRVARFFLLSQHYRSPIDFSDALLEDASSAMERITDCLRRVQKYLVDKRLNGDSLLRDSLMAKFNEVMDDDFNTAQALALVFGIVKDVNNGLKQDRDPNRIFTQIKVLKEILDILGIRYSLRERSIDRELTLDIKFVEECSSRKRLEEETVEILIKMRNYCRKKKDWTWADRIRDILVNQGYTLKDPHFGATSVSW